MIKSILFIFTLGLAVTLPFLPTVFEWGIFASRLAACICLYFSSQFLVAVLAGRTMAGSKP